MVFFDFEIDDVPLDAVSFEMFADHAPKTSGSFVFGALERKGLRVAAFSELFWYSCDVTCHAGTDSKLV